MTKMAPVVALLLALSGCVSQDEMEVRECQKAFDVPTWDRCIEQHNARNEARKAQQASENDAAPAMLLLGASAFANGYTQSRPAPTTCFHTGMITQCTSP